MARPVLWSGIRYRVNRGLEASMRVQVDPERCPGETLCAMRAAEAFVGSIWCRRRWSRRCASASGHSRPSCSVTDGGPE